MGLIVDLFAGGGGASLGMERGTGRKIDIAINHDRIALAMHMANHPETRHLCEDIWRVDPKKACRGLPVDLLWASPDCKDHSNAKGGRPRSPRVRGLAWMVVRWMRAVRPRVVMLENVPEFALWGPLKDGKRDPTRKGRIFNIWLERIRRLGYVVEWRFLSACDYGVPTSRRRLFLVARCDGEAIRWEAPSHGPGRAQRWRTAADVIDWSIPCPSIFLSPAEAKRLGVRRPLAEATLRRVAAGVRKYVIEAAEPFIVNLTHGGRVEPSNEPLRTVTAAHRGEKALVVPTLVTNTSGHAPRGAAEPLATVTTGGHHALVSAFLAQHNGGPRNLDLAGRPADAPVSTVTGTGSQQGLCAVHCIRHFGQSIGHGAGKPVGTIMADGGGKTGLVASHLTKFYGTATGADLREPLPAVTAGGAKGGGHLAEVRAFLIKYYGTGGQWGGCDEPMPTIVAKARLGLVTVHGQVYAISDIGLRMLTPRELFRAQGFPDSYVINRVLDGVPLSKAEQIKMCGNSVPPGMAEMLSRANCAFMRREQAQGVAG